MKIWFCTLLLVCAYPVTSLCYCPMLDRLEGRILTANTGSSVDGDLCNAVKLQVMKMGTQYLLYVCEFDQCGGGDASSKFDLNCQIPQFSADHGKMTYLDLDNVGHTIDGFCNAHELNLRHKYSGVKDSWVFGDHQWILQDLSDGSIEFKLITFTPGSSIQAHAVLR